MTAPSSAHQNDRRGALPPAVQPRPLRGGRPLTLLLMASCAGPATSVRPVAPDTRPNILVVMTDDQGYGDFSGLGNPVLETPRLDAFAAQCPTVDRFYVSPVCSPTRASLMTGRYAYRTGVVDTWIGRSMMRTEEVTIAEVLQDAGYRTGIFGKWHLGDCYPMRPGDQGFGSVLVHLGGGLAQPSEPPENERRYTDPILHDGSRLVQTKGFCTDVYFDAAIDFVDASLDANRPFFAYVATNAPHGPFHDVPEDLRKKYDGADLSRVQPGAPPAKSDVLARTFAMIENADQNFGRLLDHLDARGVGENTLVVFLCDNGPQGRRFTGGLRGAKGGVHEGGIRSPLWVRWPAAIDPGVRILSPAAHIDIAPTLAAAAGTEFPKGADLDGRSMLDPLKGATASLPPREIFVQAHRGNAPAEAHNFAVIGDRWKLVRASGFGRPTAADGAPFELFDLLADPGEMAPIEPKGHPIGDAYLARYGEWFRSIGGDDPQSFLPPRIMPGTVQEPITTLTKQDWRVTDTRNWGTNGVWLLHFDRPTRLDITCLTKPDRVPVEGMILINDDLFEVTPLAAPRGFDFGQVEFPAGDVAFTILGVDDEGLFDPHQVVLSLPWQGQ